MFTLAVQAEKLTKRPYIPLLKEQNIRRGFFEPAQFERVQAHLPTHMRGIAAFAYITGWRTPSEILPLEWRQVDREAAEVRLDPGATKNGDGRVFPFTAELRRVLEEQQRIATTVQTTLGLVPRHVFCQVTGRRAGHHVSVSAYSKAWHRARVLAECPTHIPHDFRRTAVRNLVRAGVPERVAMTLTGHRTRSVFDLGGRVKSHNLSTVQTPHFSDGDRDERFYFSTSSGRKSGCTFVRQLRGPHLRTCA